MNRLKTLPLLLQQAEMDALVLNPSPTLIYLTGLHFHLMERPVVGFFTADGKAAIVLPKLEMQKLEGSGISAFPYGESLSEWKQAFRDAAEFLHLDGKRIGVETLRLRLLEFRYLEAAAPHAVFPDAGEIIAGLRIRKDETEIAAMRRAVEVAQNALLATLPLVKIGVSEKDIAAELTIQLLRHGSDGDFPFAPIVSGGPNAANPHATPSERKLREGDLLVIDWGARVDGYISDITRTFGIGNVDETARRIHEITRQANEAGRAAAKAGLPVRVVDNAARQVIEAAGYGKFFTHRTGHGIGMEAHEPPYMRGDNERILETGMAFTVEPGIYLPGENGVHIEDDMILTESGAESLSTLPRELQILT